MSKGFRVMFNKNTARFDNSVDTMRSNNRTNFKGYNQNNASTSRRGAISFSARRIKQYLEADVNMDGDDNANNTQFRRGRGAFRGRGGRKGISMPNTPYVPISKSNWYKITISHARDLEQDFILKSINDQMKIPFLPVNFSKEGTYAIFYIKGHNEAVAIKALHRKIPTPSGFMMYMTICTCEAPLTPLNAEVLAKVKEVMSKRYSPDTASLNLSNFSQDPDLQSQNLIITFARTKMVHSIIDIIEQNIPELRILDLSDNNISYLDPFSLLADKAKHLTHLNLSSNKVTHDNELRHLKKLKLEELWLVANPLTKVHSDKQLYIRRGKLAYNHTAKHTACIPSMTATLPAPLHLPDQGRARAERVVEKEALAVRQKFPQLLRLDGTILPPPINFNIDSTELPPIKESHYADGGMKDIINLFLQQYFSVYDSTDRSPLIGAYHPSATLTFSTLQTRSQGPHHSSSLQEYLKLNRNLKKISEVDKFKKVYCGSEAIVAVIKKLPSTLHVASSFSVDISLVSPTMMIFSVQGIFIETSSKLKRHFNKQLVTVPNADGLAIMNEMCTVANLSLDLLEKHKGTSLETAKQQVQAVPPPTVATVVSGHGSLTDVQREMMAMFAGQSGMNGHYCFLCLSGNDWNFQQAAAKFAELKASNSIPAEAFMLN